MRGRIMVVGHEAPARGVVRAVRVRDAIAPSLEGILPMCEGQAGVSAREGRVLAYGHLEEMPRQGIFGLGEPVHVPEAAVIGFPSIERVRRLENRAVALGELDLVRDRGNDLVADLVEHVEGIVELLRQRLGPDDSRGRRLYELD